MPTEARLLKLFTWLSPAFPVGSFGYSHGLETAVREGAVADAGDLSRWIAALLQHGSAWTDAVLARAAWTAVTAEDYAALDEVAELAEALAPSAERRRETLAQGEAFLTAIAAWAPPPILKCAYPVAVGAAAGAAGIPLQPALVAWLHAFASNLVGAGVRLVPLGQTDAVAIIAGLEGVILKVAERATASTLDDLGSCTILSDVAAMRHETLNGRLFIS
ncbi:MAG: urease accessory protein UreF [Phenylobacterium sp.]|uniref:urease accessory protein UreF n=1 Tax=Phenylobacterium sp. TaxID=1871053 RepID=UPI0025F0BA9D|nr:urease accessory protein UreF [Phenylobacterium sp.]MBI1198030.1 urease accessory protein UreF [Phenylobacterium sp.]